MCMKILKNRNARIMSTPGSFTLNRFFIMTILLVAVLTIFSASCKSEKKKEKILTWEEISIRKNLPESHRNFILEFTPKILNSNNKIMHQREKIIMLRAMYHRVVKEEWQTLWLNMVALQYRYDAEFIHKELTHSEYMKRIDSLLLRVDIVPSKLVLAQAIVESGWGRSKFSRQHHNYFGIQCYTPGCGWVPRSIQNPKVWNKKFENDEECIDEYLWLLNTGYMWKNFRRARANSRKEKNFVSHHELLRHLKKYSTIGKDYTNLVRVIIEYYLPQNLEAYLLCHTENLSQQAPVPDTLQSDEADSILPNNQLLFD